MYMSKIEDLVQGCVREILLFSLPLISVSPIARRYYENESEK